MRLRSQSAMEYLMTYGWAIIIIAVVIGALYALGIFSGGLQGANTCLASPQFICNNPILYSSGALTARIGQAGIQTITITGLACTNTTTTPVIPSPTSVTLNAGQIQNFTFGCPITSNSVGTRFSGYLWIFYTLPSLQTVTQQQKVATVRVTVSSTSSVTNPATLANVSITITNSQSSPTGSSFQQLISFSPSSYSTYEASNLGNIRFYSGSTELNSWCESGCSSSSGSANFWVTIPGGVPANGNTVVNMEFLSTSTNYDGVHAGEAPQLSCNNPLNPATGCAAGQYGEYDNGASVFGFYDNFAGTSLSGSWSQFGTAQTTVVANGVTMSGAHSWGGYINSATGGYSGATAVIDAYVSGMGSSGYIFGTGQYTGTLYDCGYDGANVWDMGHVSSGSETSSLGGSGSCSNNVFYILSGLNSGSAQKFLVNYGSIVSGSSTDTANSNIMLFSWAGPTTFQWVRARAYPPNGVMPTTSFGSLTT
jgi:hypothetical protein